MGRTRCRRTLVAAAAALLSTMALVVPAQATADFTLSRVAGADRYETAASLALSVYGKADSALIARGNGAADALAGSYLAGSLGAPLLLTDTAKLPQVTKDALASLGVKNVYILGGTSAVSDAVQAELAQTATVTRISGADRYETAANVARAVKTPVGTIDGKRTAILASGTEFADALAAGPLSASAHLPIILTMKLTFPPSAKQVMLDLGIQHLIVVGGEAALHNEAIPDKASTGADYERIAGNDRYETATKLADFSLLKVPGWSTSLVDLSTGSSSADALADGAAAGKSSRSILLTASTSLSTATRTWLSAHNKTLTTGRVLGGTGAVSDAVKTAAEQAGRGA